jgi:hypothetical protein
MASQIDLTGSSVPRASYIDASNNFVEFHGPNGSNPQNDPSSFGYADPQGTPNTTGKTVVTTVGGQVATVKFQNPS